MYRDGTKMSQELANRATILAAQYAFTAKGAKKLIPADVEPKLSEKDQKDLAEKLAFSDSRK